MLTLLSQEFHITLGPLTSRWRMAGKLYLEFLVSRYIFWNISLKAYNYSFIFNKASGFDLVRFVSQFVQ